MFRKRILSRTFFAVLIIGVILLTAAVLSSIAEANESTPAFAGKTTVGQGSGGAEVQSPISNLQSPTSITYTYDDAGRLVRADYGSKSIIYTYDAAGNLLEWNVTGMIYLPLIMRNYP